MNTFEYTVQKGDTLWLISKKFGVTLDSLIAANEDIKDPDKIYPGQKVSVPMLGGGTPMPSCEGEAHVVVAGETMWLIAKKYGVTLDALIKANPQVKDPNRIDVGQKLCIPGAAAPKYYPTPTQPKYYPMPTYPAPTVEPCPTMPMPTEMPMPTYPMCQGDIHVVKAGESMWLIAKKYGVTLEDLIAANPQIKDPNKIDIGQRICVPVKQYPAPYCHGEIHVVKAGESMWLIAKKYGISLEDLIEANPQVKDPNRIDVGQKLCIPMKHPMPTMQPCPPMPTMMPMPTVHPMPTMKPMPMPHPMPHMPQVVHHMHFFCGCCPPDMKMGMDMKMDMKDMKMDMKGGMGEMMMMHAMHHCTPQMMHMHCNVCPPEKKKKCEEKHKKHKHCNHK